MGTNPSGQDDTQMEVFAKAGIPWMLRGIANKEGDIRLDLYLYEYGACIKNIAFEILRPAQEVDDPRRAFWKGQLTEKVKPHVETYKPYQGGGQAGYQHDYGTYRGPYSGHQGHAGGRSYGKRPLRDKFKGNIFGAIASGDNVPGGAQAPKSEKPGTPGTPGATGTPDPATGTQMVPVGQGGVPGGARFDGEFGDFAGGE